MNTDTLWPLDVLPARKQFALRFSIYSVVLFALYTFPYREVGMSEGWFDRYLALYARVAGVVLGWIEQIVGASAQVQVRGTVITGRYPLEIVKSCDAVEVNILFAAAVFAFPTSLRQRALGLAVGLAALVLLNVARICTLYFIGVHAPERFETFHVEVWPLCLVVATTLLFLAFSSWAQQCRVRA